MGRVNGKKCVGAVVDVHGSWRFFVDSSHCFFADLAMCVALLVPEMNARNGANSHWNHSKLSLEWFTNHQKLILGAFRGGLGSTRFHERREARG